MFSGILGLIGWTWSDPVQRSTNMFLWEFPDNKGESKHFQRLTLCAFGFDLQILFLDCSIAKSVRWQNFE